MTSAINAWVRDIIIMVVILGFVEMMLPQNGLKRMVRVVIGIAVIGVILNPVLDIKAAVERAPTSGSLSWGSPPLGSLRPGSSHVVTRTPDVSAYIERGRQVAVAGGAAAAGAARGRIERQVRALALMAANVEDAKVRVRISASGELEGIDVDIISRSGGETMKASLDRIAVAIADFCGVPKEMVQVSPIPPRGDYLERK